MSLISAGLDIDKEMIAISSILRKWMQELYENHETLDTGVFEYGEFNEKL